VTSIKEYSRDCAQRERVRVAGFSVCATRLTYSQRSNYASNIFCSSASSQLAPISLRIFHPSHILREDPRLRADSAGQPAEHVLCALVVEHQIQALPLEVCVPFPKTIDLKNHSATCFSLHPHAGSGIIKEKEIGMITRP